jgi:hypothetical protein
MKKQTVIAVIAVTGLLILAFIGGTVVAQGEVTSSTSDGASFVAPPAVEEDNAGSAIQAAGVAEYSTLDGQAPSYAGVDVAESDWHFVSGAQAESSSSDDVIQNPGPTKVEPSMSVQEAVPDAPTWNSSVRYLASTLKPRTNNVNYTTDNQGGCVYVTSGNADTVWNIPLSLPQGNVAEIMRMYFRDNYAASNITGWFSKYDLYGNLVVEWGVSSTTTGNNWVDVAITPPETIDYGNYSYVFNFRPNAASPELMLCGFRLFFTAYSYNFMPVVIKH